MKLTKICLFAIMISAIFMGCARPPKKIKSCTIKVATEINENSETYLGMINVDVDNTSTDTIFNNVDGTLKLTEKDGSQIVIPFKLNKLLPFNDEIVIVHKFSEEELKKLLPMLDLTLELFHQNGRIDEQSISDEKVSIEINSYEKENIYDALRSKIK